MENVFLKDRAKKQWNNYLNKIKKILFITGRLRTGHSNLRRHIHKIDSYNGNQNYKMCHYGKKLPDTVSICSVKR